jgi:hypothetical protein
VEVLTLGRPQSVREAPMSCERSWWDYVGAVNGHVAAIQRLTEAASQFAGMNPEDTLMLDQEEVDELLELIGGADASLRIQLERLEAYFVAMQGHDRFVTGCRSGNREHDI